MGDVQTIQNADQLELRNRKPSPSKVDHHTKIVEDESNGPSVTSLDPNPTIPDKDPSLRDFRSLTATNTAIGHIRLSLPVLSHETKEGPILGTLKLGYSRDNTFGLGDPAKEKDVTWENLKRTSQWTHATYEFSFGDKGERRTYIWQRTKQAFFSDQPNMELREKLMSGGMGEILAVYRGNQGMMLKSRGTFWISKGLEVGELGWEGKKGGEWSCFELMALLSGLGIIESSRRRARARRSGGGIAGGGG